MKSIKIGIVGARLRNSPKDKQLIKECILHLIKKYENVTITVVSGGCPKGADRFAEEIAKELNLRIIIHYPDGNLNMVTTKNEYRKLCFARNTLIANDSDMLIAMPNYDEHERPTGGTADTINKTRLQKKPVVFL
jgi:hypothetical protein